MIYLLFQGDPEAGVFKGVVHSDKVLKAADAVVKSYEGKGFKLLELVSDEKVTARITLRGFGIIGFDNSQNFLISTNDAMSLMKDGVGIDIKVVDQVFTLVDVNLFNKE